MQRSNRVTLQIEAYPEGGDCRAQLIPARAASTHTPRPSRRRLAKAWHPASHASRRSSSGHTLPVAFAKGPNPVDLANAVGMVSSVSRFDTTRPTVTVPSLADFVSDQSGLVVNAGPRRAPTSRHLSPTTRPAPQSRIHRSSP